MASQYGMFCICVMLSSFIGLYDMVSCVFEFIGIDESFRLLKLYHVRIDSM